MSSKSFILFLRLIWMGVGMMYAGTLFAAANSMGDVVQLLVFQWGQDGLAFKALGSGTIIGPSTILTNKHVVISQDQVADVLLICKGDGVVHHPVVCKYAGGVKALHPSADLALVGVKDHQFFTHAVIDNISREYKDHIRVVGFPFPVTRFSNFGSEVILERTKAWLKDPSFQLKGSSPTVTRGNILARVKVGDLPDPYILTDAKIEFGGSGGAVFNVYGKLIGVPTFKDEAYRMIFLELAPFRKWVEKHRSDPPQFHKEALQALEGLLRGKTSSSPRKVLRRFRGLEMLLGRKKQALSPQNSSFRVAAPDTPSSSQKEKLKSLLFLEGRKVIK